MCWVQFVGKNPRILWIYTQLIQGKTLFREQLAEQYGVSEKSIERDIQDLREFFEKCDQKYTLIYNKKAKSYTVEKQGDGKLSVEEILPILKTVFESGTILPERLFEVLNRVVDLTSSDRDRKIVDTFLIQERECYQPPLYQKTIGEMLYRAEKAVWEKNWIKIRYHKSEISSEIEAIVLPQAVVMREKRFFLVAQTHEGVKHNSVLLYRIDRISSIETAHIAQPQQLLNQKQLRNQIISLSTGEQYEISFVYHGTSILLIREKLPHAQFVPIQDGWQVTVRVYGKGIGPWLRSMGKKVSKIQAVKATDLQKNLVGQE